MAEERRLIARGAAPVDVHFVLLDDSLIGHIRGALDERRRTRH